MKYDVYMHNDFDGRASATVLLHFLESRGDTIANYYPVDYTVLDKWRKETFLTKPNQFGDSKNPAIVVDFLYHPKAAIWFDHHPTTFKKDGWEENFKKTPLHHLDASYPSCCHLVLDVLAKESGYKPPHHLKEFAKWLDIIDGALYKNALQPLRMKEPAIQLNQFIEGEKKDQGAMEWLIKLMAYKPMKEVVEDPRVKKGVERVRRDIQDKMGEYRKHVTLEGVVAVSDLLEWNASAEMRFAPYSFYPECRYGVIVKKKNDMFHIGAAINPWNKPRRQTHIGELLKEYGGGGHRNVGGLEIKARRKTMEVLQEIIERLNKAK